MPCLLSALDVGDPFHLHFYPHRPGVLLEKGGSANVTLGTVAGHRSKETVAISMSTLVYRAGEPLPPLEQDPYYAEIKAEMDELLDPNRPRFLWEAP